MVKVFLVLRIPISAALLFGYAAFHVGLFLGAFVLLGIASVRLLWFRNDALAWTGVLLAAEPGGAVLLANAVDIQAGRVDRLYAFLIACAVVLLWTLPNVALLYRWRWRFAGTRKPGL
jgi:hypothetical protein